MTKKIASKYTFLIVIVIIAVTLVFVPLYIFVQQQVYIRLEIRNMKDFYEALSDHVDFSDAAAVEEYIEENNEKNYTVILYNDEQERIFTTRHRPERKREGSTAIKISKEHAVEYSEQSEPQYRDDGEADRNAVVLRKIVSNHNQTFYIFLREDLRNIESIFSYTNKMLGLILVLYILVCGILTYLLMHKVTGSIRNLNDVVQKISQKDYSVRYECKISNDEVGILASNFNNMVDIIQDNIASINNYNFLLKEDLDHIKEYEDMRNSFVRNATHELKTPLAIISSQVEMMNCTKEEEKKNYYYESAMEEIRKMSTLITNFLRYSVTEGRTLQAEASEIDLSRKIRELCKKMAQVMHAKKLQFLYEIEEGCILHFSEMHVEYIFNNYMMNAMRFTPRGGMIRVTFKKKDAGYHLAVYNDGRQIPKEQKENIWKELYRIGDDQTDNTGLGLFIVKEISLINHMECGVDNCENGVEFWFEFEYAAPEIL